MALSLDEVRAARAAFLNPVATQSFTAYCDCPACGRSDVHLMREPKPAPKRGPARVIEHNGQHIEVQRWDGMTGPDESMYEVIRICAGCGKEFGQA